MDRRVLPSGGHRFMQCQQGGNQQKNRAHDQQVHRPTPRRPRGDWLSEPPPGQRRQPLLRGASVKTLKYHPGFPGRFEDIATATALCRSFFPWVTTPSIDMPGSQCSPPMTCTTVEPARSSKNASVRFASPGASTRSDSSTEPRNPSLFHKRSGSTRRPRLPHHGLLSNFQPSVSQSR